jgi:hypothetical protein
MSSPLKFPYLEGWVTVSQASEVLKLTRQACHKLLKEGKFNSVVMIGSPVKPIYLISVDSLKSCATERGLSDE